MKKKEKIFPFKCDNKECDTEFTTYYRNIEYRALSKDTKEGAEASKNLAKHFEILAEKAKYPSLWFSSIAKNFEVLAQNTKEHIQKAMDLAQMFTALAQQSEKLAEGSTEAAKLSEVIAKDYAYIYKEAEARFQQSMENREKPAAPLPPPPEKPYHFFDEVVGLWGFICLRDKSSIYFGFTCPECKKTTIYQYDWKRVKSEFEEMIKVLSQGMVKQYVFGRIYWFIAPFSPSILMDLKLIGTLPDNPRKRKIRNPQDKVKLFSADDINMIEEDGEPILPDVYPPHCLPGSKPFVINPQDIDRLLWIENTQGYKAFPRFVRPNSIYLSLDDLTAPICGADGTIQDYCDIVKKVMRLVVGENREQKKRNSLPDSILPCSYERMIQDNISIKKYNRLNLEEEIPENILFKNVRDLRNAYIRKRNQIDFEMIYKVDLINIYAIRFFRTKKSQMFNPEYEDHRAFVFEEMDRMKNTEKQMTNADLAKHLVNYVEQRGKNRKPYSHEPFDVETYKTWISERHPKSSGRPSGQPKK